MILKMYIAGILIEKRNVDFDGCETMAEREAHLEMLIQKMKNRHKQRIRYSRHEPVYFLDHVQSKMNYQHEETVK